MKQELFKHETGAISCLNKLHLMTKQDVKDIQIEFYPSFYSIRPDLFDQKIVFCLSRFKQQAYIFLGKNNLQIHF
jgi:hypothetical protein